MSYAQSLFLFFRSKIEVLHSSIPSISYASESPNLVTDNAQLIHFYPLDLDKLIDFILKLKPSTSPADFMPAHLFREVFSVIGPAVLAIINNSLSSGVIPSCLKHLFLKKPNLNLILVWFY